MGLGSIADMFNPPYGDIIKELIKQIVGLPLIASMDMNFNPFA